MQWQHQQQKQDTSSSNININISTSNDCGDCNITPAAASSSEPTEFNTRRGCEGEDNADIRLVTLELVLLRGVPGPNMLYALAIRRKKPPGTSGLVPGLGGGTAMEEEEKEAEEERAC